MYKIICVLTILSNIQKHHKKYLHLSDFLPFLMADWALVHASALVVAMHRGDFLALA